MALSLGLQLAFGSAASSILQPQRQELSVRRCGQVDNQDRRIGGLPAEGLHTAANGKDICPLRKGIEHERPTAIRGRLVLIIRDNIL